MTGPQIALFLFQIVLYGSVFWLSMRWALQGDAREPLMHVRIATRTLLVRRWPAIWGLNLAYMLCLVASIPLTEGLPPHPALVLLISVPLAAFNVGLVAKEATNARAAKWAHKQSRR
ncbi:MAG: hypothetical protein Q8M66_02790 [Actinomycetota bacterium]|nr:hypothetical protein [Actinomycetota bacterium]MDZ4178950.1 hypothetical protein [Coriobacteriia bacterium]